MKITDEMVQAALDAYFHESHYKEFVSPNNVIGRDMKKALEAAFALIPKESGQISEQARLKQNEIYSQPAIGVVKKESKRTLLQWLCDNNLGRHEKYVFSTREEYLLKKISEYLQYYK